MEGIKEYIENLKCISTFRKAIGNLNSEDECFNIEGVNCNPIINNYLDGSSKRQFQFVFCTIEAYNNSIIKNIEKSNFYEELIMEIENKSIDEELRLFNDGIYTPEIQVISTPYIEETDGNLRIYKINMNLKYYKKRG